MNEIANILENFCVQSLVADFTESSHSIASIRGCMCIRALVAIEG
jgi:hypothetical protein